jgi:hypothetical protein
MTRPAARRNKNMLHQWFGPNRNTHWTIAGAVCVIMLGSYLVYSTHDNGSTTAAAISATERAPAPPGPAPLSAGN